MFLAVPKKDLMIRMILRSFQKDVKEELINFWKLNREKH